MLLPHGLTTWFIVPHFLRMLVSDGCLMCAFTAGNGHDFADKVRYVLQIKLTPKMLPRPVGILPPILPRANVSDSQTDFPLFLAPMLGLGRFFFLLYPTFILESRTTVDFAAPGTRVLAPESCPRHLARLTRLFYSTFRITYGFKGQIMILS